MITSSHFTLSISILCHIDWDFKNVNHPLSVDSSNSCIIHRPGSFLLSSFNAPSDYISLLIILIMSSSIVITKTDKIMNQTAAYYSSSSLPLSPLSSFWQFCWRGGEAIGLAWDFWNFLTGCCQNNAIVHFLPNLCHLHHCHQNIILILMITVPVVPSVMISSCEVKF